MRILFLTRFPNKDDLRDGYFQRVLAIDNILSGFIRYYVNYEDHAIIPVLKKIKDDVFEIKTSKYNPLGLLIVGYFTWRSHAIYLHSILRLNSIFHRTLFLIAKKRLIDLHGAVPEELECQGKKILKKSFEKIENFSLMHANIAIGVSKNLLMHVKKKHGINKNIKYIILPTVSETKEFNNYSTIKNNNSVIYCGGLQKWQQVEKMLEYVHRQRNACGFTFLVTDPEAIKNNYFRLYKERFPGVVQSVNSDGVQRFYSNNSFGLVLREDILLNQVACPTKLIEYLQNDIIPIVDSENIGDFNEMGYQYVSYKDELPTQEKWFEMIRKNREVLEKFYEIFEKGKNELRTSL